jgi:hypothetical protein
MTCPDYVTSKRGRQGLGVVQPQSGLNYPLVAPSADIKYLIADFYLSYDDDGEYLASTAPAVHPLRIKYLYGVGCIDNTPASGFPANVHAADVVIVDANERIILNTNSANVSFNVQSWGTDYKIYEWKSSKAVCRLVTYTTWPDDDYGQTDDDTRRNYNKSLTPVNAKLDERAVYKMPRRLLSVRVKNGQTTTAQYRNKIVFANGYNSVITPAPGTTVDFRNNTNVLFSAVAGSGLGKYGDCADTTTGVPITKINGVAGKDGHFLISGTDCLWARRPVNSSGVISDAERLLAEDGSFLITEAADFDYWVNETNTSSSTTVNNSSYIVSPSTTAQQQIGADCQPCCACSDYSDTAKYINDTSYRYALIGQRAERVRTEHLNNITRWADQRACSVQRPLRLLLIPQRCPFMDIVLLLCNPCKKCFKPAALSVTLSIAGADGKTIVPQLEPGYTEMYAPGINNSAVQVNQSSNGLTYSVSMPELKAGDSAYVKFRVRFSEVVQVSDDSFAVLKARGQYAVTGVLTGSFLGGGNVLTNCGDNLNDGAAPPAASAETTRVLNCNSAGQTIVSQ